MIWFEPFFQRRKRVDGGPSLGLTKGDHALGLMLACAYTVWLASTSKSLGFGRDESFYFYAAESYSKWFALLFERPADAFLQKNIDSLWSYNHEHPPLMKSLFGLSYLFFYEKWHVFHDASLALRLPGMVVSSLSIYLVYLFTAQFCSKLSAVVASCLLAFMPRVFFHAHLACFDGPVMSMWTLSMYSYFSAWRKKTWLSSIFAGLCFGLCLSTKHNAWLWPPLFLTHLIFWTVFSSPHKLPKWPLFRLLICVFGLGPIVLFLLWPWIWFHTESRLHEYIRFHLHHDYYNIEFLGKNYYQPPFPRTYLPVMTFATVPFSALLLFVVGWFTKVHHTLICWKHRQDEAQLVTLLSLGIAVPIGVFFLPTTPIFGGTKHWFPAYPAMCVFAGYGFEKVMTKLEALRLFDGFRQKYGRSSPFILASTLASVTLIAPFFETLHSHPFGLSTYTPFVGGVAGAANLGLNRQFWGYTTQSLAPYLQKEARHGDRIFIHDTTMSAFDWLKRENRIPSGLEGTLSHLGEAKFAIVHHELHMNEIEFNLWNTYGVTSPSYVYTYDGVPIISVYEKKTDSPSHHLFNIR